MRHLAGGASRALAFFLVLSLLAGPARLIADDDANPIDESLGETHDPWLPQAERIRRVLNNPKEQERDELLYILTLVGTISMATGGIISLPPGIWNFVKAWRKISEVDARLGTMKSYVEVTHGEQLDKLEKLTKHFEDLSAIRRPNRRQKSEKDRIGAEIAKTLNAIVEVENPALPVDQKLPTTEYDAKTGRFVSRDPRRGPHILEPKKLKAEEISVMDQIKKNARDYCEAGYASLVLSRQELVWQRRLALARPAVLGTAALGTGTANYFVNEGIQDRSGKTPALIRAERTATNAQKLRKATDLLTLLKTLKDPSKLTDPKLKTQSAIMHEFIDSIHTVLKHHREPMTDYFKENVPKAIQDVVDVEEMIKKKIASPESKDYIWEAFVPAIAKVGTSLGEFTPDDVIDFLGTTDKAKLETTFTRFLVDVYAEGFQNLFPKFSFQGMNADAKMSLVSPIIEDTLLHKQKLDMKIRTLKKKQDPPAAPPAAPPADGNQGAAVMPPAAPGAGASDVAVGTVMMPPLTGMPSGK